MIIILSKLDDILFDTNLSMSLQLQNTNIKDWVVHSLSHLECGSLKQSLRSSIEDDKMFSTSYGHLYRNVNSGARNSIIQTETPQFKSPLESEGSPGRGGTVSFGNSNEKNNVKNVHEFNVHNY